MNAVVERLRHSTVQMLELAAKHHVVLVALLFAWVFITMGERVIESPLQMLAGGAVVVFVIVVLYDIRLAFFLFIAGLVLLEEFELSSTEAFFEADIEKTIIGLRFFGLSILDAVTFLFLVPVFLREWLRWHDEGSLRFLPLDVYLLPFIAIYLIGTAQGLFNTLSMSNLTWELRDPFYILSWYFIASRTLRSRSDVVQLFVLITSVFTLKSLVFIYRVFAGKGLFYGFDFYRPALGTDVPMMAVMLAVSIAGALLSSEASKRTRWLLYGMIAYWSIWFVSSLGRASYITGVAAIVFVLFLQRKRVRWFHVAGIIATAIIGGFFFYYVILTDVNRQLVGYLIGTAFSIIDAVTVYGDRSMGQRVLEFVNIAAVLTQREAWLLGLGWGAPWSEIAVHIPYDVGSFDIIEWRKGVHTYAHLDLFYFLLKVGIVGTVVLYGTYLAIFRSMLRLYRGEQDRVLQWTVTVALVMIIIFIPNYVYFTKLKFLLGIIFGAMSCLMAYRTSSDASQPDAGYAN